MFLSILQRRHRTSPFWKMELDRWRKKTEEAEDEEAKTAVLSMPGISVTHVNDSQGNPNDPEIWFYFTQRGEASKYMKDAPQPYKKEFEELLYRWYRAKFQTRIRQMRNQVVLQAFWDEHH